MSGTTPLKVVRPKYILPQLHEKTHFKAALEYAIGQDMTAQSLRDDNKVIKKIIQDSHLKL